MTEEHGWIAGIEIIGKVIELLGIVFTGGKVFPILPSQIPLIFGSALYKGERYRSALNVAELLKVNDLPYVIRGIAFILFGIILQMIPYIVTLFHYFV